MAEIREFEMSDDAFIEMVGSITPDMSDEEIMVLITVSHEVITIDTVSLRLVFQVRKNR